MRKKFLKNQEKQQKSYGTECKNKNIKYLKGNGNGNDEKNG